MLAKLLKEKVIKSKDDSSGDKLIEMILRAKMPDKMKKQKH